MPQESISLAKKKLRLQNILKKLKKVVVALSGGVDSSLVMAVSFQVLKNNAIGAIAVSDSLHPDNFKTAKDLTKLIGVKLIQINTQEVTDRDYQKNTPLRCYFCKHVVYSEFKKIARAQNAVLVDGFNLDDVGESRPGMRAAKEEGVRHPLFEAGLTKKQVRQLAKEYGLPNWNKSADACLSSRILTGIPLDSGLLKVISRLETEIRKILNLGPENTIRLRYLGAGITRVELDNSLLPLPLGRQVEIKKQIQNHGYTNVSIVAYQRGSVSAASPKNR